ncbi:hypothetical protein LHK_01337 [Laribacter hongkongensis HLHK9]|uniref:Uncharacterized protein n=1 Tax=Laribacter hongkongensis (strain HLHK9) TaxID=557598 RepID=C1D787_LARHH|nr:hypothetical protein LHK_01337 [Laribacter hongkongensis HLHK9]
MLPADQRLGADHSGMAQVHLGLVIEHQLTSEQPAPQVFQQGMAGAGFTVFGVIEDPYAGAAFLLGNQHGGKCLAHHAVRIGVGLRQPDHAADTGTQFASVADRPVVAFNAGMQGFQPGGQPFRCAAGQHHDKIIAGQAGQTVIFGQSGFQAGREFNQHLVAGQGTVFLVDVGKPVEVQMGQQQGLLLLAGLQQHLRQAVDELLAAGQAGQVVIARHADKPCLHVAQFFQIVEHGNVVADPSSGILHGPDGQSFEIRFAGFAPVPELSLPDAFIRQLLPQRVVKGRRLPAGLQQPGGVSDGLFSGIAGNPAKCRIDIQNPPSGVSEHGSVTHLVKNGVKCRQLPATDLFVGCNPALDRDLLPCSAASECPDGESVRQRQPLLVFDHAFPHVSRLHAIDQGKQFRPALCQRHAVAGW